MRYFQLLFFAVLSLISTLSTANVEDYFSTIKSDPNALYAFFKTMPKGGELHYHLAGGAYPETMFDLATHGNYCLKSITQTISPASACDGIHTLNLAPNLELYQQVIRAWSMKNFIPGKESAHDHFFATFYKFIPIEADFRPELLAEIMKRASNQHELYLEVMVLPDNAHSASFAPLIKGPLSYEAKRNILLSNKNFQKNIDYTVSETQRILTKARHELGCEKKPEPKVCNLSVKFQYFVLREQPLENVFAQALNAFAAAALSKDIVGVNLVQAEDGIISLQDYQQQMHIFEFLHTIYPKVHISLHAGELAPKEVVPAALRFHIHDAILIGHAERIGHGVDIAYEDNADNLLQYMSKTPIPVEINLTSNKEILGIDGNKHPLNYYLHHHVPVVLSTDDEGILRTDLTREYVKAVLEHHLDYETIKNINRNALTYSFLSGRSLWADPIHQIVVNACQEFNSKRCLQFIKQNEKAKLQWQLELQLTHFEAKYMKLDQ